MRYRLIRSAYENWTAGWIDSDLDTETRIREALRTAGLIQGRARPRLEKWRDGWWQIVHDNEEYRLVAETTDEYPAVPYDPAKHYSATNPRDLPLWRPKPRTPPRRSRDGLDPLRDLLNWANVKTPKR